MINPLILYIFIRYMHIETLSFSLEISKDNYNLEITCLYLEVEKKYLIICFECENLF